MTTTQEPRPDSVEDLCTDTLTARIRSLVAAVVERDEEESQRGFEHVLTAAKELFRRKVSMSGTKSETRDLVGELLFSRLRKSFRVFVASDNASDEIKAAEWALGALINAATLGEVATAIDRVILEGGSPRDYSFAGRADFIGLEEVLQLLGGAKHRGCLSLEKDDARLDVYFDASHIAFLDPHQLVRRVWPGSTPMEYREIAADKLEEAQRRHATDGTPIVLTLNELGVFRDAELREILRQTGTEALFEFLRDRRACAYVYRRQDQLPAFVTQHDFGLPVTPILLEGNKQLDDWQNIARVFPDPTEPIEPVPDMFAQISSLDLSVLEIKMLSLVNGENTPTTLVPQLGLPLHEVYNFLVRFAKDGVIVPPCRPEVMADVLISFDYDLGSGLQSNDVDAAPLELENALDKVLGDDGGSGEFGDGLLKAIREHGDEPD